MKRVRMTGYLMLLAWAAPSVAIAADCRESAAAALDQLAREQLIEVLPAHRDQTLAVLERLCAGAVEQTRADLAAPASEPTRVLGIDFEKAPKDSAGNKRLRK